jgi:radical SAM superfamily enzyme YgiQ (UPF0313 family)
MEVLLTHGYFLNEDSKEAQIMKPYPPLGILYISAYLKQNYLDVSVFDSTFSSFNELTKCLIENKPKYLALYANLVTKINLLKIIKFVKNTPELNDTKIILGGPDVTYNYENYLANGAEYIVIGEGEQTIFELIQALKQNTNLEDVNGIAYLKNEEPTKTKARIKIKDIDELPFPDRKAIDLNKYLNVWKAHHGKSTISISTQRGCPYTCKWCSTAVYGQSYRRRSPQLVADEIESLIKDYNPNSLWFVDDVFTVSHKWITAIHQEFIKRGIKIPFECITRAERLNAEVLRQLKEMGCEKIWIGAESGSQKIIDLMDRKVKVEQVREMIIQAQEYGIEAGTFIMIGYPQETFKDIKQTIKHLKIASPAQFTITVTYPIMGTSLHDQIKDKIINKKDWSISTDRDIEFTRTYSRKYYDYAVRYVVNSVNAYKQYKKENAYFRASKSYTKALLARIGMTIYK